MWLKKILLLAVLLLLFLPSLQKSSRMFRFKPLNTQDSGTVNPAFACSTWLTRQYQQGLSDHLRDSSGFREIMIRGYNQLDYSLFSLPHARLVVAGKKGYLFEEQYIKSYFGQNFTGTETVERNAKLIRDLQDSLWSRSKTLLLVIFTPDKASFYPEYIPDRFRPPARRTTNLQAFLEAFNRHGVNYIDFNDWFIRMKDTSSYLLYPKAGIHWSSYGGLLAADSLARYLRKALHRPVPFIVVDSLEKSDTARYEDNDIERGMNLLWRSYTPPLCYPHYHFITDSTAGKPRVLFVGDSFYWTWYWPGIISGLFENQDFLYYNQQVYPKSSATVLKTSEIDLVGLAERQEAIILIQTTAAYGNPGYGFVQEMMKVYLDASDNIAMIEQQIRNNPEWMDIVRKKAHQRHISVDEMVRRDAEFIVELELGSSNSPKK